MDGQQLIDVCCHAAASAMLVHAVADVRLADAAVALGGSTVDVLLLTRAGELELRRCGPYGALRVTRRSLRRLIRLVGCCGVCGSRASSHP